MDKEIALCTLLDVEGAFDNTPYISLERAAVSKGMDLAIVSTCRATARLGDA